MTSVAPLLHDQLRALPEDAFTRLQYLAPAVGCFNRCAFCSQSAGRDIWQFTAPGLARFIRALAEIADERGLRVGGGRPHRPGVLFPYLDNDAGSYPHLDTYAGLARDVLRVRLRISTVGYSAHSPVLSAMHRRIVAEYGDAIEGVRFSVTPYTAGYTGRGPGLDRDTYTADLAAALATYRPLMERLGHGPATAACELRFAPLLSTGPLTDTRIGGRHVLACGPHLFIARGPGVTALPTTTVRLGDNKQPLYSRPGRRYLHITADQAEPDPATIRAALDGALHVPHHARDIRLHAFTNADGPYYAADPDFHSDGRFTAVHLYPRTDARRAAGYTDASRHLLNAILARKAARGLGRREEFPDATSADVRAVLDALTERADTCDQVDHRAASHLRGQVIPQATAYARALELAGYPPTLFFSPRFTIDTGQIVNQGRARGLFRGLAATADEPMTPREERGYGAGSLSTARGPVWRITPLPYGPGGHLPPSVTGRKNPPTDRPAVLAEELDPHHLAPVVRSTSRPLRRHTLTLATDDIEHIGPDAGRAAYALPGLIPAPAPAT
jgi:hypothetical protein